MTFRSLTAALAFGLVVATQMTACTATPADTQSAQSAPAAAHLDRTVLPIPQPVPALITEQDVRKARMPPRLDLTAPKGAPNVLLVLIDDMGFGQPAPFGGPINMPTVDRVAKQGLRYNRFHTTAVCSATRAALLNGNNSHSVNAGEIADTATGFPGNTFIRPDNVTPLAEILRLNGYSTAAYTIVFHFTPDDPQKPGSGRKGVLSVDGKQVAEVRTPKMVYGAFSGGDGLGIGVDDETNVSLDYKEGDNAFTGRIGRVTINVK